MLRLALGGLLLLYGLLSNGYLAVRILCISCSSLTILVYSLTPWVTLVNLLLQTLVVSIALIRRQWRWARNWGVWLLPGTLAFLIWFGPQFIPQSAPPPQSYELRVATFNILGSRLRGRFPDTLEVIKTLDADLIGFQEYRWAWHDALGAELAAEYPYRTAAQLTNGRMLGLISRYPIIEDWLVTGGFGDRAVYYIRVLIDFDGQPIEVFVFHAPWLSDSRYPRSVNYERLMDATTHLWDALNTSTYPTLVLCDCNAPPDSPPYEILDEPLHDTFREHGQGFGFTDNLRNQLPFPVIRIDYIWHSDHFMPLEVKVGDDTGGSDHYPVWARLVLHSVD